MAAPVEAVELEAPETEVPETEIPSIETSEAEPSEAETSATETPDSQTSAVEADEAEPEVVSEPLGEVIPDSLAEEPVAAPTPKPRVSRAAKKRAAPAAAKAVAPTTLEEPETVVPEEAPTAQVEEPAQVVEELVEPPEVTEAAEDKPVVTKPAASKAVSKRPSSAVATRVDDSDAVLRVSGLSKSFSRVVAVDSIDLEVKAGDFYGIVGPNGAGKTTTLSMITGLLRPDSGTVTVHGADVWSNPIVAKRNIGVLPDRLRLFDRLTGVQMLYYAGVLRGLDRATARSRSKDLASAFGLDSAMGRLVADYSAGMTKKIALAAAMIHSPRLLVLDEPFESVDPVSEAVVTGILKKYTAAGGTVLMSSHSMELVERICDSVAVVVDGRILADGTIAEVQAGGTLEARFRELAGVDAEVEGLEWLHSFSD